MRKTSKTLVIILVLSSFLTPIISVNASLKTAQSDEIHFRFGIGDNALSWDPANYEDSWAGVYRFAALENFVTVWNNFSGDPNEAVPMLATDWDFEYWPEEMNSKGFINRNGVSAINLTLRENVTFHDGSIWNATVAKWNLDRLFVISGNLTGNGDTTLLTTYWFDVKGREDFFTPSWNLSWAKGRVGSYNGLPGSSKLLDHLPEINNTQVIDPGDPVHGGGTFRIEFNEWNAFPIYSWLAYTGGAFTLMMSMKAYQDDYTDAAFPSGYGAGSCIGTGPYIYDHYTPTGPTTGGLLLKNYNYWDREYWENQSLFDVTHIDLVIYSMDTAGRDARNLALYSYNLDFGYDMGGWEMDYATVTGDPNLVYAVAVTGSSYEKVITLNCANETWWPNYVKTDGIPRLFRKALSYAFDYDSYIQTAYDGRAFRTDYWLGSNHTYNQGNIDIAYMNLTIAREAMLGAFPTECAARGLNTTNLDDDNKWHTVASVNPIFTMNFYWDSITNNLIIRDEMIVALEELGCDMYTDYPYDTFPDNELTNVWLTYSGEAFPQFDYNGLCGIDWTVYANDIAWPYVYEYFRSFYDDGSYQVGWNLSNMYNDNVTAWLEQIYYANLTQRQVLYDQIGDVLQNYEYPWIWVAQSLSANVFTSEWEVVSAPYYGNIANFLRINYIGWGPSVPEIPGYTVGLITAFSLIAMIGVITQIKRKHKF
jgi:ABC-type transport system substrate-binding protein